MNTKHKYMLLEAGLRAVNGAWGAVSRELASAGESDSELHDAYVQVSEGLQQLTSVIRGTILGS